MGELDELEVKKLQRKAYLEDEARILAAAELERGPEPEKVEKVYGVFKDSPQLFRILWEQVGNWNRNEHRVIRNHKHH